MIVAAMDLQYTAQLDKEYVGFTNETIKMVLEHVWGKWCKVTTAKRTEALVNFHQIWYIYKHVNNFALRLKKQQILCRKVDVKITNISKTQFFVEKIIERKMSK